MPVTAAKVAAGLSGVDKLFTPLVGAVPWNGVSPARFAAARRLFHHCTRPS